jgi:hypothetical protein
LTKDIDISKQNPGPLPLTDEDLASVMDKEYDESSAPAGAGPPVKKRRISYAKLFFTLVFAAPCAAFLTLAVMDVYKLYSPAFPWAQKPVIAKPVKKPAPEVKSKKQESKAQSIDTKKFADLIASLEKSNKSLIKALEKLGAAAEEQAKTAKKQTKALEKIAKAKPDVVKVSASSGGGDSQRIIVVKVPSREKFDLQYELQKVLTLSGVDLDDPVTSSSFGSISSRDALKEILNSINAIIAASRDHAEVGEFLKSNALAAKKIVQARLKKIK